MNDVRPGGAQPANISAQYAAGRRRAERHLFWKGLYPHAVVFAPLLMALRPGHFKPDRELVHGVANATTPAQFRDELTEFMLHPANNSWLRSRLRLRVSTRRVERFAILCLGPHTPVPAARKTRGLTGNK
jgi:hypothetical protein